MTIRMLTVSTFALAVAACAGQKAGSNVAAANAGAAAMPATPVALSGQGEWQRTASGIRYRKVSGPGTGAKPAPTDVVTLNYVGKLADGTEFDSSRGTPVTFPLPDLIPGWQEGVPLMNVGDTYEFMIPPELGYGASGSGPIPPNAPLYFQIELLGIGGQG